MERSKQHRQQRRRNDTERKISGLSKDKHLCRGCRKYAVTYIENSLVNFAVSQFVPDPSHAPSGPSQKEQRKRMIRKGRESHETRSNRSENEGPALEGKKVWAESFGIDKRGVKIHVGERKTYFKMKAEMPSTREVVARGKISRMSCSLDDENYNIEMSGRQKAKMALGKLKGVDTERALFVSEDKRNLGKKGWDLL